LEERQREVILYHNIKFKILIFVLIGSMVLSYSIFSLETIEEIEEGNKYFQQGNYRKALTHFLSAKEQNPNSTKALLGYAKTSLALGSIRDARISYERCLVLNPKEIEAMAGIGRVLVHENKLNESRSYLENQLKQKPNDPILILSLAETFEAMNKPELAIFKLESLNKKIGLDYYLKERLGYLYLSLNQMQKSSDLAEELIQINPTLLNGFLLKGKINANLAYQSDPSSKESSTYFSQSLNSLENALVLSPKNSDAEFWMTKLLIWKGSDERKKAIEILKNLNQTQINRIQSNISLASILSEQNSLNSDDLKIAIERWKRSIEADDTNEIIRYNTESFAIKHLPEDSNLRKTLGKYRIERYNSEVNSLYYDSSIFHLIRANELLPNYPEIHNILNNYYSKFNLPAHYINLLTRQIKNDPTNFKLQNKLEYAVLSAKKSLEYREGFLFPEGPGFNFQNPSTSPKILILDFTSENGIEAILGTPRILQSALRSSILNTSGLRLATMEEENQVRTFIESRNKSSWNPYHRSVKFDINETAFFPQEIRFIGFGKSKMEENSIAIEFQLYDRKTGKFSENFKIRGSGRSSLSYITSSLISKIKKIYPIEGEVLKINKNQTIVNLGTGNGLTKNSKLEFYKGNKILGNGTIKELGEYISIVTPNFKDWERELATGEKIRLANP
jgi:tetratricopeptide (TPR) repeat protein